MSAVDAGQARDYVYGGRRLLQNDRVAAALHPLQDDGRLGEGLLFDAKLFKRHVIGGVYRGATFTENKGSGLGSARFVSHWPRDADRIDWRMRDEEVEAELRTQKLVKDAKKVHEIEAILLPLRKLYDGYAKRRDHGGREALEEAVIRALRSAPRSTE